MSPPAVVKDADTATIRPDGKLLIQPTAGSAVPPFAMGTAEVKPDIGVGPPYRGPIARPHEELKSMPLLGCYRFTFLLAFVPAYICYASAVEGDMYVVRPNETLGAVC